MRSTAAAAILGLALPWLGSCTALEAAGDTFGEGGAIDPRPTAGSAGAAGVGGASNGGSDGGGGGDGVSTAGMNDAGASSPGCPAPADRPVEDLANEGELAIESDTAWTCQSDYLIKGNVLVAPGATLAISPGTRVLFEAHALLLLQRGAKLNAEGTAEEPIVFTSAAPSGKRAPGDWRGIVLIGDGPSQTTTVPVYGSLNDARAHFGGGQAGDAQGSCGSLRYVRVEFAGGSVDDPTLPGAALTLAGCGAGTRLDYVQVHRATDGVGLLGGSVPLRHLLVTNNLLGRAITWTGGYTGTMQFVVAQSLAASAAMQGSNSDVDEEASPVSRPSIYNATLIGSAPIVTGQHYGLLLQLGSRAVFKNSIIAGFADAAFDLRLAESVLATQIGPGKPLDISHVLLHENAADYAENAAVLAGMESMRGQDPGLDAAANPTPEMPDARPEFAPSDPTVNTQATNPPAGFDTTAGYRGGVPQDGSNWTLGWTDFASD